MIAGLLIASAIFLYATNWERVREINLFALVLVVQSLPFLAAVATRRAGGLARQRFRLLARAGRPAGRACCRSAAPIAEAPARGREARRAARN